MPFFPLNNSVLLLLIKLIVGAILVLTLKKYSIKNFIVFYIWFLTYTFALGGICFGIMYMLNPSTQINGAIINGFDIPVSLFLLIICFYVYILAKSINLVRHKQQMSNHTYFVVIKQNNISYNLQGFLDTGNHLYSNGQPVVIISKAVFLKIFKNIYKLTQNKNALENVHYINVNSASTSDKILVFKIDEMLIFKSNELKNHTNALVGIAKTNFGGDFDCLLHLGVM